MSALSEYERRSLELRGLTHLLQGHQRCRCGFHVTRSLEEDPGERVEELNGGQWWGQHLCDACQPHAQCIYDMAKNAPIPRDKWPSPPIERFRELPHARLARRFRAIVAGE